jgi:hypothetical protein
MNGSFYRHVYKISFKVPDMIPAFHMEMFPSIREITATISKYIESVVFLCTFHLYHGMYFLDVLVLMETVEGTFLASPPLLCLKLEFPALCSGIV